MKYINLLFSSNKIEGSTDNITSHYESTTEHRITEKDIKLLDKTNIKVLSYLLRSNETVEKWIDIFLRTQKTVYEKYGYKTWYYNYYTTPSWDLIHESRKKMNNIIDYINQKKWFEVPEELKLEVNNTEIIEKDKLNELHFIFEDVSLNSSDHKDYKELFYYLEAINNLVHLCEKYSPNTSIKGEYHSYRLAPDVEKITMKDSDYERMESIQFGTVALDFGTIGKDLGHCFASNDINLVKRREIKQQAYIRPFLSFDWTDNNKDIGMGIYEEYYEWCEKNNVQKYGYEYKRPKYNLGRVILGDIQNKEISKAEDVHKVLKEYPYFVDIILTEEPYLK